MVSALRERGIEQLGLATIVGTGATARSAMVALARMGASAVHVVGRSPDGRHDLVALGGELGVQVIETELAGPEVEGALAADVVVTTIPSAAAAALTTHLPAAKHGVLFDVLYDPWPTPIAQAWQGPVLGGLDLLVHQAIGQLELMTGRTVPVDVLRRAGVAALAARASAVRPLD
jgi:shikimate dehydrogenase